MALCYLLVEVTVDQSPSNLLPYFIRKHELHLTQCTDVKVSNNTDLLGKSWEDIRRILSNPGKVVSNVRHLQVYMLQGSLNYKFVLKGLQHLGEARKDDLGMAGLKLLSVVSAAYHVIRIKMNIK